MADQTAEHPELRHLLDVKQKAVALRIVQRRYFAQRKQVDLELAKRLEREIDGLLEVDKQQPDLFDEDGFVKDHRVAPLDPDERWME